MAAESKVLPELPPETWIDILTVRGEDSKPVLGYHDLKRVGGVSQMFKELLKAQPFDDTLFRGTPHSKLSPGTTITLHPLLDAAYSYIESEVTAFEWENEDSTKSIKICTLASVFEFATSPPLKTLVIGKRIGPGGRLKVKSGITVIELLKKIAELWSTPFDDTHLREDYPDDNPFFKYARLSGPMTYHKAIFTYEDHNGWAGWKTPSISTSGLVTLSPRYYDS
ncbi:hypothetical protein RQP46_003531 [Phenoliferia psychrophenolica]